jgi:hypothetical protein
MGALMPFHTLLQGFGYTRPFKYEAIYSNDRLPQVRILHGAGGGFHWECAGKQGRTPETLERLLTVAHEMTGAKENA